MHMVAARPGFEKAMVGTGKATALTAWTGLENTTLTLQRASLVPRHQIFRVHPAALSKNRVWTPSLVKLGCNYTSVVSCCRTNQIAQVK